MKRVKREKASRAYSKGYGHGIKGRSRDLCPFERNSENYQSWVIGWREGREDFWAGHCTQSTFKRTAI